MNADPIPTYSVGELNNAIGSLLERGFAPRFLVDASVSRPQLKKGHLWLTLTDGDASISAVVWASRLKQLSYEPKDGDGVTVVGKLNFWAARASLTVQALDIRPSLTTVLRLFEQTKNRLLEDGVIDPSRSRPLPQSPSTVAILTSAPSSALADILRTARERWPATRLLVIPIPVQGAVAERIRTVLNHLASKIDALGVDALVLARGGGSREDLAVFDDEELCRDLARFPVAVVTGLGHDDDLTVADLVADHRAATPTAAIVALLPDRHDRLRALQLRRERLLDHKRWWISREQQRLKQRAEQLEQLHPALILQRARLGLEQKRALLDALSPQRWLRRGLVIVQDASGRHVDSSHALQQGDRLSLQFADGAVQALVETTTPPSER
ncbi:MAG: exodeoxyribonuclease VII large subunit [Synechococcus sp.]